ncbi:sulfotransferase 1C2-like isoform X2 [Ptychodera flava]|uniref:sulfotransferase 1C2-like isoform X2 n=1 Tax=Ptychodera flava TaxID=63121 RepID=UPI00396A8308
MTAKQEPKLFKKTYLFSPGYVLPAIMEKNNIETTVKNFEVRDEDVFLVTYPKAGTNWTMEIISAIQNIDNIDILKEKALNEKVPLLELGPSTHPDLVEEGITDVPSLAKVMLETIPKGSPRGIPTHLFPEQAPAELFKKKPKTIVVDRNPKDCLISLYNWHLSVRFLDPLTWEEMFDAYMKGLIYGDYCEFTKAWAKYKNEPWIFWIRYEDIKKDHKGSVKRIAEFMGKSLTDAQVDEVVRVTGFQYMKKANETIKGRDFILRPEGVWQRKGVSGGWKNTFTVFQNEAFDKYYDEKMKGYEDLKYEF